MRNQDPDYAYILMSRTPLGFLEDFGAQHDEIRRKESRRLRFPPLGVNLNLYNGVDDEIVIVTTNAGAVFVHGRTGRVYLYHEDVEGFVNMFSEAYLSFWERETPYLIPPATELPLPVAFSAYPAFCPRQWMVSHCSCGTDGSPGGRLR